MKWVRRLLGWDRLPEGASDLERLEYAMRRMPRRDREIFMAHRLDDMSYADIAALTGLSAEQVQGAVARALVALDRALN